MHLATFVGSQLNECVDFSIVVPAEKQAKGEKALETFASQVDEDTVKLSKLCRQQITDREALATCVVEKTTPEFGLSMVSHFYNADTLLNDQSMKNCFENGGDWQSVDRLTVEHKKHRKQLRESVERAGKFVDRYLAQ